MFINERFFLIHLGPLYAIVRISFRNLGIE